MVSNWRATCGVTGLGSLLIASGNKGPSSTEMPDGSRFLHNPYSSGRLLADIRELIAAS